MAFKTMGWHEAILGESRDRRIGDRGRNPGVFLLEVRKRRRGRDDQEEATT